MEMTDAFDRLNAALSDRYAIERELGSGGMATVYLAEDLKHHRKVAVKVIMIDSAVGRRHAYVAVLHNGNPVRHPDSVRATVGATQNSHP